MQQNISQQSACTAKIAAPVFDPQVAPFLRTTSADRKRKWEIKLAAQIGGTDLPTFSKEQVRANAVSQLLARPTRRLPASNEMHSLVFRRNVLFSLRPLQPGLAKKTLSLPQN